MNCFCDVVDQGKAFSFISNRDHCQWSSEWYQKSFSTKHVLIRFLQDRMKKLDNVVGAVLTDLSKAFDCISHNLLVAKLDAHRFNKSYIYWYLNILKIGSSVSEYLQYIISGVRQGPILGPILYDLFLMTSFIWFY